MPFGKKPKETNKGNTKPAQQGQRQPVVDLPETKLASNTDPGTWGSFDKESEQDKQRRSSKTSGASSVGETKFGPDVLFDQDEVTPPPGRRKPTLKSMGHKLAKSVGLSKSKGASNSEEEPQTPLSPTTDSQGSEDASNLDVHSPERGGVRRGNDLQEAAEHPLSPNRVPTLDSYIELPEDEGGTSPLSGKVICICMFYCISIWILAPSCALVICTSVIHRPVFLSIVDYHIVVSVCVYHTVMSI